MILVYNKLMTQRLLLSAALIFFSYSGFATTQPYLWIQHQHGSYVLESGNLDIQNKKVRHSPSESISRWKQDLMTQWNQDTQDLMIVFHCLYGSQSTFFKNQARFFDEHLSQQGYQVLYIKWEAPALGYAKNYNQTAPMMDFARDSILSLFRELRTSQPDKKINVFCHSMGNRVFSLLFEGGSSHQTQNLFDHIYLVAPDLPENILNTQRGQSILESCSDMTIFYHNKDRLLKTSGKIHGIERLGLNGLNDPSMNSSIRNLEATGCKHRVWWASLSNHLYYFSCDEVMAVVTSDG
ncbi:alpha/beta hydrolase [bacterium SCSIO 12741]|nr:alpha/beta hydrolase [bacterium SCSIO 12741]